MKKRTLFSFVILVAVIVVACSKKDDDEPTKTKTDHLTAREWTISRFEVDPPLDTVVQGFPVQLTDITILVPLCTKDDYFKFNSDGTTYRDEGATKCADTAIQRVPGTWVWANNQTELVITEDNETTTFRTVTVNETQLRGITTNTDLPGHDVITTFVPR